MKGGMKLFVTLAERLQNYKELKPCEVIHEKRCEEKGQTKDLKRRKGT
jgi:hypothetical protein